jgi:pimeloyl-ACP methyl ester carboxylesterase
MAGDLGATVVVGHSMGGMIILQLAAAHQDCVAAMFMVESTLVFSPEQRTAFDVMAAGIYAGDQQPRTQFIKNMFLPTSDRQLVEHVTAVMLAAPPPAFLGANQCELHHRFIRNVARFARA